MQSIKTTATIVIACQTANAISIDRVKQLTVKRNGELFSMESMIEDKREILAFDEIIDSKNGTISQI